MDKVLEMLVNAEHELRESMNYSVADKLLPIIDECKRALNCDSKKICKNCKYWGFNNGLMLSSVGTSMCKKLKRMTQRCGTCTGFIRKREQHESKDEEFI